ncbi:unnamed protein product [Phytophthora fragariaefolia]|uniref:Unnamed protein product n=1 Tax=Phytophthora fragariaefolia TaxID=1490495 RepID=A0A9W6TZA1_9STRA|nr:unnamed protein product [Phytophthora fragariaefolia]
MPRKGTRSSTKIPTKKAAGAPETKSKPRGRASVLAKATQVASAAIQSPGASNAPSSTHSRQTCRSVKDSHEFEVPQLSTKAPLQLRRSQRTLGSVPLLSRHTKRSNSFGGQFDSSSDDEEEVPEPEEIANDIDGQQERYHAVQLQSSNLPPAQASVPVQSTQTSGELDQLKAELALSSVLDQRELRIEFVHLIAKRQLSVAGIARDERGYGAYAKATIPRSSASTPRTTYEAAVASGPRSQSPSGSLPGAGPPAPTSSVTRGIRAGSHGAGASQGRAAPGEHAPHGSGGLHSGLEEPMEASYDCEPLTTAGVLDLRRGPSTQRLHCTGRDASLP